MGNVIIKKILKFPGGQSLYIAVPVICEMQMLKLLQEIHSPLNRFGAQCAFGVHDPTLEQLGKQHFISGATQRFFDNICNNAPGLAPAYLQPA